MLNAQSIQSRSRLITKTTKPTKITKHNSVVLGGLGELCDHRDQPSAVTRSSGANGSKERV
jgi:hypothetical protein